MVSFYDQETANRRNSVVLVFLGMLALALLGYVIGYALTGDLAGAMTVVAIALGLSVLSAIGSYFGGDQIVLRSSAGTGDQPPAVPGAVRRRRGDGDGRRRPDAPRLHHRRPLPQRVRDGP